MRCVAPWVQVYHHTDGGIYPCCKLAGNPNSLLGHTSQKFDDVWNCDKQKNIRRHFIKGQTPPECAQHCINTAAPFNEYYNGKYGTHINSFKDLTSEDGMYSGTPRMIMVASSNVCNFKCIYCSGSYSCLIYNDKGTQKISKAFSTSNEFVSLINKGIDRIIFAGGESAIQDEYYTALTHLKEIDHTDVAIEFITNLSTLTYKTKSVIDELRPFKNATIVGSVDSVGDRQEFIRKNSKFTTIETNLKHIISNKIKFVWQPVITNLSVHTIPDLHYRWVESGLMNKGNVRYILLTTPEMFCAYNQPISAKSTCLIKLAHYMNYLKDEADTSLNACTPAQKIKSAIKYILTGEQNYNSMLDHFRDAGVLDEFYNIFTEFK